jgi:hypothetical protein
MNLEFRKGDAVYWVDSESGLRSQDVIMRVAAQYVETEGGMYLERAWCNENLFFVDKPLTYKRLKPLGAYPTESDAEEPKKDDVYHPPHYARWKMEPIEFIAINDLPWWLANVIKYTMRFDAKDGLQDLRKARSYLDMKIREVEGVQRFWDKPVTEERRDNGHA